MFQWCSHPALPRPCLRGELCKGPSSSFLEDWKFPIRIGFFAEVYQRITFFIIFPLSLLSYISSVCSEGISS